MDAASVTCAYCHAAIPPAAVDRQREIASCSACGRLNDVQRQLRAPVPLQAQAAAPVATPLLRARPPVRLPQGMSFTFDEGGLFGLGGAPGPITIRRRWLRGKHQVFLFICLGSSIGVMALWFNYGLTAWTVVATLFVLSWDYNLTTMFVNSTVIRADTKGVSVEHGPLPSLFGRGQRVAREQVKQLFATNFGGLFAVKAQLVDGKELDLVKPLVSPEQALFVEQQLEKSLGITDFAVEGELDGATQFNVDGTPVAGARSGAFVGCLIPLCILGTCAAFYFITKSEVSGTLQASTPVGSWSFAPDDCSSGQLEGFAGVTLTSEKEPGRALRLINDPVKGKLVVLMDPGAKNQVFTAEQCPLFLVDVYRSTSQINGVWSMYGDTSLHCPGLQGRLSYAGCH